MGTVSKYPKTADCGFATTPRRTPRTGQLTIFTESSRRRGPAVRAVRKEWVEVKSVQPVTNQ